MLVPYAQQYIAAGDAIMWDHDGIEVLADPPEGGGSQPTAGEQHFQRVISDITRHSTHPTAMAQAPAYAAQPTSPPQPRLTDRGASSVARGASLVDRGASSVNRGASSVERGASLVDRGASSADRGASSVNRGASPVDRGASPVDRGASPGRLVALGATQDSPIEDSHANESAHASIHEAVLVDCYLDPRRPHICKPPDLSTTASLSKPAAMTGIAQGSDGAHSKSCSFLDLAPGHCTPTAGDSVGVDSSCVGVDSVERRTMKHTKNQFADAKKATELIRCVGYTTPTQCFDMLERLVNPPTTKADVKRAIDIYGPSLTATRGRTTKTTTTKEHEAEPLKTEVVMEQIAEVDFMFVREEIFLMCLLSPLEFSFTVAMVSKSIPHVRKALESVISASKARGFTITTLRVDNETIVASPHVTNMLANHHILIDTVAPGDHVSKVEGRIRSIKGKWQVLLHTLDYVPSKILVRGGVIVANRLVNMQRCSISLPPESPREKFPGRLTDYKRDISGIASGSHIQASVPNPNNSDATKTETCLVLAPKDNQTRTYFALNLDINEDEAEATENEEEEVELQEGRGVHQHQPFNTKSRSTLPSTNMAVQDISKNDLPVTTRKERVKHQRDTATDSTPTDTNHDVSHETVHPTDSDDSGNKGTVSKTEGPHDIPEPKEGSELLEYNEALAPTGEYVSTTTDQYVFEAVAGNMSCSATIGKHGSVVQKSIEKETFQFINHRACDPVRWSDLSSEQQKRVTPPMMPINEKHTHVGTLEQLKTRLVTRGDKNTSSPRSQHSAVTTNAHERCKTVVYDIPRAFLHASMKEGTEELLHTTEPVLTSMLAKQYSHKDTKDPFVKPPRAVRGTIEDVRPWLHDLTTELNKHGYVANPYDQRVFNKINDQGNQRTICLYVDDLLITCVYQNNINEIPGHPNATYGGVKTPSRMTLDPTNDGYVRVTIDGMIEDTMLDHFGENRRITTTLYTVSPLEITDASPLLTEQARMIFHTAVAKMLLASDRARSDNLTTVELLVTRATKATEEDQNKLQRPFRYVSQSHAANHEGITLHIGDKSADARGWANDAYYAHDDFKTAKSTGSSLSRRDKL